MSANADPLPILNNLRSQLAHILGEYRVKSGTTPMPAIIKSQNIDTHPSTDWNISGLECVLVGNPEHFPKACFRGVADLYQWHIYLIQHDRDLGLEEAIECILGNYQRAKIGWHRQQSREDFEQVLIYLPSQQYFKIS